MLVLAGGFFSSGVVSFSEGETGGSCTQVCVAQFELRIPQDAGKGTGFVVGFPSDD